MKKALRSVRFWITMLIPISIILTLMAKNIKGFADGYQEYVYKYISVIFNNITGIVPFSIGEIIVILFPLSVLGYLIYVICSAVRSNRKIILNGLFNLLTAGAVILFLFTTNCGINYYATGVAEKMDIKTEPVSSDELYRVCVYLAERSSEIRKDMIEDEKGVAVVSENADERAKEYVNRLMGSGYSKPKGVMLSRGMSYLNITGVYFPFTFEANINTDAPSHSIPSTMCHELAHVNGVMHEEDANFISFLACINSGDREFEYSGYMMSMIYASNALYQTDKTKYYALVEHMSEGVIRDLNDQSEYWKQFETPVAEVASSVNDSYLKSNAQKDGVESYGKMVDLIIGYMRGDILPRLRFD